MLFKIIYRWNIKIVMTEIQAFIPSWKKPFLYLSELAFFIKSISINMPI